MSNEKKDILTTTVRANIPNPNFPETSNQPRVIAKIPAGTNGSTAITADGTEVRITDAFGVINENVIVNP